MTHGQTQAVSQILLQCFQKLRYYTKKKAFKNITTVGIPLWCFVLAFRDEKVKAN